MKALPSLIRDIKENSAHREHNSKLFDIYEGELLKYVEADLAKQLSQQSFATIQHRIAPINVLKKIIDKLSTIYQQPVTRTVVDGTDLDSSILSAYELEFDMNQVMNVTNEFFNLFKNTLIQPYLDRNNQPRLRAVPSNSFQVFSYDIVEPTRPTGVVVFLGNDIDGKQLYSIYTDDEILIVNEEGVVKRDIMAQYELDGSNPFGRIPFTYVNRSMNLLTPKPDISLLKMTTLTSILLSDMNLIAMFSAFSILFGINVKDEGLTFAPNAFWNFSQIDPDAKPEIGTLKNEGDIAAMIDLIKFEVDLWLNSIGLKSSSISGLDTNNISGISKMLDEIDTSEDRKRQVGFFKKAEADLWDLILNHLHPRWIQKQGFPIRGLFTPSAYVNTDFSEQIPMVSRGDVVEDLEKEMNAGFISKRRAIKRLNPQMTEDEIDELIAEIDQQNMIIVEDIDADDQEA